jgi:hypothetical protein
MLKAVHHHKKFDDVYTRRERHNNRSKRATLLHSDLTTPMLTNTAQSDLSDDICEEEKSIGLKLVTKKPHVMKLK